MHNQEQFLALLHDALESIREPRLFATERGFQGELLAQLRNRLEYSRGTTSSADYWVAVLKTHCIANSLTVYLGGAQPGVGFIRIYID
ncbi:MAG: hypothetical protein ACRD2U_04485 [Terriglobales bacterium]